MDIVVVVPSEQYLKQAGPRIRYMRIKGLVEEAGHTMELRSIDSYLNKSRELNGDIFLFSKCLDARAIVLSGILKKAGKIVGVDFFDDYFSQLNDSRFVYIRQWLRAMSPFTNFAMASTPGMLEAVKPYLSPKCAEHILNDPFGTFEPTALADLIDRKIERTRQRREIRVGWFGIGDNPHFAVGIDDLFAYGGMLSALGNSGYRVLLRVLTNSRAMGPRKLEKLARLPVSCEVDEWSESRERALIADSLLCFLPVNAQNFSIVKSLNRGITTLVNGAQILSAGFPLYQSLSPFVYRDPAAFLADLDAGCLAMRRETMAQLAELVGHQADPRVEAANLVQFASNLLRVHTKKKDPTDGVGKGALFAVLHGRETVVGAHKLAGVHGLVSVGSPFTKGELNFHAAVATPETGILEITMGSRLRDRLDKTLVDQLQPLPDVGGRQLWKLRVSSNETADVPMVRPGSTMAEDLGLYQTVMAAIARTLSALFPDVKLIISERESPFWSPLPPLAATG